MANYKTGAQRYNDKMDKIFKNSEELGNHTLHGSTESKAKSEALKKKMSYKKASKLAIEHEVEKSRVYPKLLK